MESKIESSIKKLQKDVTDIKRDLKGVWSDIKRLDKRLTAQEEEISSLRG